MQYPDVFRIPCIYILGIFCTSSPKTLGLDTHHPAPCSKPVLELTSLKLFLVTFKTGHTQALQAAGNNFGYLELQLNLKGQKYLSALVQGFVVSGCVAEKR